MPSLPMALTVIVAVAGLIAIVFSVARLIALVRASVIVRLPAIAEQDVDFAQAGRVVLCIEQSRLDSTLWRARFALRDATGRDLPAAPILMRTEVSGFSRVRLSVQRFDLPNRGRYRLIADGIAPGNSDAAIVFTRPFAAKLVIWILAIVLGGFAMIGGIVLTALRATGQL